jgi:hypothetical protein
MVAGLPKVLEHSAPCTVASTDPTSTSGLVLDGSSALRAVHSCRVLGQRPAARCEWCKSLEGTKKRHLLACQPPAQVRYGGGMVATPTCAS